MEQDKSRVFIIAISGVTGSSKQQLTQFLKRELDNPKIICQDEFWEKYQKVTLDGKSYISQEDFTCTNWDRLFEAIVNAQQELLSQGNSQNKPIQFLIIKGFQILYDQRIQGIVNIAYNMELPKEESERRQGIWLPQRANYIKQTKIPPNRGDSEYFNSVIWPIHEIYQTTVVDKIEAVKHINIMDTDFNQICNTILEEVKTASEQEPDPNKKGLIDIMPDKELEEFFTPKLQQGKQALKRTMTMKMEDEYETQVVWIAPNITTSKENIMTATLFSQEFQKYGFYATEDLIKGLKIVEQTKKCIIISNSSLGEVILSKVHMMDNVLRLMVFTGEAKVPQVKAWMTKYAKGKKMSKQDIYCNNILDMIKSVNKAFSNKKSLF